MSTLAEFWNWLRSDWGKPNFLTRAGVPRIATNLLTYLLVPYAWYLLTLRYAPASDKQALRLFVHNPLVLLAYAVFYVTLITDWFLHFRYGLKGLRPDKRFGVLTRNWTDPLVKVYWLSLASSLVLLLFGAFYFRHQMR